MAETFRLRINNKLPSKGGIFSKENVREKERLSTTTSSLVK